MNVIVVMSDSFRRDHVGAFGNPWIKTPNLDRFASQATVFPQYRIGSYATIPIRTDLFTGPGFTITRQSFLPGGRTRTRSGMC